MQTMKENRLIHITLAQLKEQQKKAGTTVSVAPVNARAAQTASQLQNANVDTKGLRLGSNANAGIVERSVLSNRELTDATPEQLKRHEEGLRLAQGGLYAQEPGVNPAKGIETAQQETYANQAAGLDISYLQGTQTTQAAGQGELEQSAIDSLREGGKTDEEIRSIMSSPEFKENIRTTMSNTGLGGTERQSKVLTVAQAQNILANSRSPKERAEAQALIDAKVNDVKGYDQVPIRDKEGNVVGYKNVENAAKTAENQQRERERQAQEEANRLASQQAADEHKKFVAGIDTSALDQTKTQIETIMSQISGLSPDLQAAVLPGLISLQNSNNETAKAAQEITNALPTDEEIESGYDTMEEYIKSEDLKYKDLLARNLETSKEVAEYNRDALELDKKITDHDAAVAEQNQLALNVDGEKKLRRQLNRLGIQTDLSGLNYLQSEIQKGADALANLKKGNNLVSLRAQLAIGEGYRLEVKQAMEGYEANYLNITSQTTERLQNIQNSISTAKSERNKEYKEVKKWELEQKNANDKETRASISDAHMKMIDEEGKLRDDERASEESAWSRLEWAVSAYGQDVPPSILKGIQDNITGVNLNDVGLYQTLAERKAKKTGGGTGGGSYDYSGAAVPDSQIYSGINANQLREAVDRVTLNFGGTGAERNRKRGEYLGRINSGESTASIMASMQADYWASQKGAPRTAHDGRTEAQGSADSLQSFADFYSISGEDDGPLGQVDSRVEGFKSWFGASSEEYNNLANNVGNIRARIIKENYGAAVTPQELSLAQSYIPSMTDKGAMFITKLQNLKAYNAYLDAKVFSSAVGLPAPAAPTPVQLTGSSMSGPGKYSQDDILSALQ